MGLEYHSNVARFLAETIEEMMQQREEDKIKLKVKETLHQDENHIHIQRDQFAIQKGKS